MNKKSIWNWIVAFTIVASAFLLLYSVGSRYYMTPILMYHHIDGRSQDWKLSVSPDSFEKQMRYLKSHGYKTLHLNDYIRMLHTGERIPRKTVIVTFDDGYKDNFTTALPILSKYDIPATIFIQVDGIG